jgi:hypothetical protein
MSVDLGTGMAWIGAASLAEGDAGTWATRAGTEANRPKGSHKRARRNVMQMLERG